MDERGNRKRAERAVQHALAKSERVHLLRRNAGLRLVSFTPIARKVIKTAGPTSTASPVRPGSSSRPLAGATISVALRSNEK